MYRIRFHGRGGSGMKTAGRILGSAFFAAGFEVQDAPRYGAERRGAPIFATVRASRRPIHERGDVARPDLVVLADESLVRVAAAGVLAGVRDHTVLLIHSEEPAAVWKTRLQLEGPVVGLPLGPVAAGELPLLGVSCAAGAARLLGAFGRDVLEGAIRDELADLAPERVAASLERALGVYDALDPGLGPVVEGPDGPDGLDADPAWIELPLDDARRSAPDVRAAATSVEVRTGLWRTMRPEVDRDRCRRCHWVCSTFCPDGAIAVDADEMPQIDLDHCKGCMICVAVCPSHAITAVPEASARAAESGEDT